MCKFFFITLFIFPLYDKYNSFGIFKAFQSLSNDIILITEDGIIKCNPDSNYQLIYNFSLLNITLNELSLECISFKQFPLEEGGYILLKVLEFIFILTKDANKENVNIWINEEIKSKQVTIIPYLYKNNTCNFFIGFINNNNDREMQFYLYQTDFKTNYIILEIQTFYAYFHNNIISCELMYSLNYTNNKLLVCFAEINEEPGSFLTAYIFDPENGLSLIILSTTKDIHPCIGFIISNISQNRKISLICYISLNNLNSYCLLYDLNKNLWSERIQINKYNNYNINYYNKVISSFNNNEFFIYFNDNNDNISLIYFNDTFNINKTIDYKCYTSYSLKPYKNNIYYYSIFLYKNKYYLYISYLENQNYKFEINEIENKCFEYLDFNSYNESLLYSTLLSTSYPLNDSLFINETTLLTSYIYSSQIISSIPITINSSIIYHNTSYSTSSTNVKNDIIEFFNYNNNEYIIKGNTNIKKEEINKNLNDIMEPIEIGKNYQIIGEDFYLTIKPINSTYIDNTTQIDFSSCEKILREKYNMSSSEILTFLQIELNNNNEQSLINQVEYQVYNNIKEKLNLSYCVDTNIKIFYSIKDNFIDLSNVKLYSENNIDIFNIRDSFFNDFCNKFSISNNDITLKDRISDIYQNYSICEVGCEYEKFDIETKFISCSCGVKQEINTIIDQLNFKIIAQDVIKDSNFEVIKCYKLVFSFENKLNNIGFLVFIFPILIHFPLFILYFINNIKPIKLFVYKEMEKNNYLIKNDFQNTYKDKKDNKKKINEKINVIFLIRIV